MSRATHDNENMFDGDNQRVGRMVRKGNWFIQEPRLLVRGDVIDAT